MRDYHSAPSAIDGLLNNNVDAVLTAECVVVGNAFEKENIGVIGSIDQYQATYHVGRKTGESQASLT